MAQIIDTDHYPRFDDEPEVDSDRKDNLIHNMLMPIGAYDGSKFLAVNQNAYVKEIEYWLKEDQRGNKAFKCLDVKWSDGKTKRIGTANGGSAGVVKFNEDERITEWNVYNDSLVNGIFYKSTRVPAGANFGGTDAGWFVQPVGSGKLLGFHGLGGDDIDALGAIWAP